MTTAITRRAIRRLLYDEIPILGFAGTADTLTGTTLTDSYALADSNLSVQHFKGCYIYRPDRTDDDRVKKAGNLVVATGVLSQTGGTWANTSDLVYEIVGVLHPDELNACIQRAQRRIYFEGQSPLTLITDGDMSSSGTASWTAVNTAHTKLTTATNVFTGLRSSRAANSLANGYIQSGTIRAARGSNIYVAAVVRCDSGTGELVLWDVTNGQAIQTVSTTEEEWVHLWWLGNVGSTCEEVALRLRGVESDAVIIWDSAILIRMDDSRFYAPSHIDEPFKLLKLRQAQYRQSLGSNVDIAQSRVLRDWATPREFMLEPFHPEANPYVIQLVRPHPTADMWIESKRPFSDLEPLTNDTDTTVAPQDLIVAYAKLELANLLIKRFPGEPRWIELKAEAEIDTTAEAMSRPDLPQTPLKRKTVSRV